MSKRSSHDRANSTIQMLVGSKELVQWPKKIKIFIVGERRFLVAYWGERRS